MSADPAQPSHKADIAPVAALLADPARAAMVTALLNERPLAAGELARLAGVSPATASAHLARLLHARLLAVESQGRHRYYRLAGTKVAAAIEALAQISPSKPVTSLRESQQATALGSARTCYDHLAGRAGVALLDALLGRGIIARTAPVPLATEPHRQSEPDPRWPAAGPAQDLAARQPGRAVALQASPAERQPPGISAAPQAHASRVSLQVTAAGEAALDSFGIKIEALRRSRRRLAGECLDWTERRPHLNGALGAALTARMLELGWIERGERTRAIRITEAGRDGLAATFGCSLAG